MATPRQKVQVGIFLTVCSALLVGALVAVSGLQRESTVPYHVIFNESVSGLFPGSDVRYRGVPVGRVTAITVLPTNRIRVQIETRPSVIQVRQGMTATLGTTGVTGQLYVDLSGGETAALALAPDTSIPSAPSLFANLSAELPTLLASINTVLVRLDKAMGEDGQVATILQDVQKMTTVLAETTAQVGPQALALLTHANDLVQKDARVLLTELTATAQAARRVFTHTEPALKETLESSARTFKQLDQQLATLDLASTNTNVQLTLQRLAQLAEQIGRTNTELTLTLQHLRGNTTNAEFHIRQAVRSLRETLLSAKQLFDYLEQDPSALVVGKRVPAQTRDRQGR